MQHNTEGINCEKCQKYFYRPSNVDPSSPDACPACNCNPAGSRATGQGISYLECVRDKEMALFHNRVRPNNKYQYSHIAAES